jgi:hypothetical protein
MTVSSIKCWKNVLADVFGSRNIALSLGQLSQGRVIMKVGKERDLAWRER